MGSGQAPPQWDRIVGSVCGNGQESTAQGTESSSEETPLSKAGRQGRKDTGVGQPSEDPRPTGQEGVSSVRRCFPPNLYLAIVNCPALAVATTIQSNLQGRTGKSTVMDHWEASRLTVAIAKTMSEQHQHHCEGPPSRVVCLWSPCAPSLSRLSVVLTVGMADWTKPTDHRLLFAHFPVKAACQNSIVGASSPFAPYLLIFGSPMQPQHAFPEWRWLLGLGLPLFAVEIIIRIACRRRRYHYPNNTANLPDLRVAEPWHKIPPNRQTSVVMSRLDIIRTNLLHDSRGSPQTPLPTLCVRLPRLVVDFYCHGLPHGPSPNLACPAGASEFGPDLSSLPAAVGTWDANPGTIKRSRACFQRLPRYDREPAIGCRAARLRTA
ncbi:hypothetical protein CMUS01_06067 [Colletotrichum musicola]|uniref:Uncharacterized protein n=1 Tax=Colletotrichum musicola TaxID=2175873 RepID=A0A8H6NJ14_9PEZI|nr:hypothetical protein CMUS01_06067 [Colletotrichum musicola]